jgi:hypothetical protein
MGSPSAGAAACEDDPETPPPGGDSAGSSGAAVPSKGCGKADGVKALTTGGASVDKGLPTSTKLKITSGGQSREYIIDIPADYDATHPYRLVFSWHQAYGSATRSSWGGRRRWLNEPRWQSRHIDRRGALSPTQRQR